MKKHELLVPCGNMDCLYQAIHNGCDAVYLGLKDFGARHFASNFDEEEMLKTIKLCHLYGVRIYVTMNTLIMNNEVEDFIKKVRFLHKNGVDAIIVQDFGMICYLREKFPNLEIHASTQANISSRDVCKMYHDLGVKRVVFSRELSIDEINSIDVDIEKEVFIHGALCISYSGCCLMSSMLGGRSGNRGKCAGSCRMPYTLYTNNKKINSGYLLSTKELNTSSKINELLNSNIDSFKIEGRMKGPLYVGFVTRFYRKLIDGEEISYDWYINSLKTIFNREFTVGRLFNEKDSNFMNIKSPNHVGLEIGDVVSVNSKKIKIKLYKNQELNQNDAVRFVGENKGFVVNYLYDENGLLTSNCRGICYLDNKVGLIKGDKITKTNDYLLTKMFEKVDEKKIDISYKVYAYINKPFRVIMSDGINNVEESKDIVLEAKNKPIDSESIKNHLSKLGDTPFKLKNITIDMDSNIFIPVSLINTVRRELSSRLKELRENNKVLFYEKDVSFNKVNNNVISGISCTVRNEEQLLTCISLDVERIYVSNRDLYLKYENYTNIYYYFPREKISICDNLENRCFVSSYANYNGYDVIGNYTLNVTNIYTAYYLQKIGFSCIPLSVELSKEELEEFINLYKEKFGDVSFEVFVYGRIENMIIKGNILNIDNKSYILEDTRMRKFPVYYDGYFTHVLNHEYLKIDWNMIKYPAMMNFSFYDENEEEIISIVKKYQKS